jgi:hypothetical protein
MSSIKTGPTLSKKEAADIGRVLAEILLDTLPGEIKKTGRGREYFEQRMLGDWFPDLTEDEKVLVLSLTKAVLDKAFPA